MSQSLLKKLGRGGTATVYINPYSRQGHTCGFPLDNATLVP